jgi:hypothetical protein
MGSHAAQNSRILAHDWFRQPPQVIHHNLHLLPSVTCICRHVREKKVTSIPTIFDVGLPDIAAKVRLAGPVRGRGAVCRDLEQDLRRIKALGVRCIVWYFLWSYLPP